MNAGPLFFIVRAETPIRSFADLRGRRIAVGPRTSGMVQHAHVIFGALGASLADVVSVYLDFASGAQALAAGEVDAQFQCPIPNKVMTELAARVDLRVVAYAPAELESVLRAVPYYRRTVMRKGAFRGLDADTPQLAVVNVLVTHPRVAEATVHVAVEAIVDGRRRARPAQSAVRRDGGAVRATRHARRGGAGVRRRAAAPRRAAGVSRRGVGEVAVAKRSYSCPGRV